MTGGARPTRRAVTGFDAFLSHSSANRDVAARVEAALGAERVWFDRSDIRIGALLGRELLGRIRESRTLVLLWSEPAGRSPWVQAEWIAAANLRKPILTLTLDATALPQCLANAVWQPAAKDLDGALVELGRSVRGRLPRGGSISPSMSLPDPELEATVTEVAVAQEAVIAALTAGDVAGAKRRQRRLDRDVKALVAAHPLDPRAATLWAYHAKNGVLLDHDDEVRAGVRVIDERLEEARWRFLHALWLDPFEANALNGLGTVAWFGHDLDSAEFFVRAALRRQPDYQAARDDLQLIGWLKRRAKAAAG
jgi:hypothetical protein